MSVLLRASELIGLCVAKLLITVDNFIQPKKRFGVILSLLTYVKEGVILLKIILQLRPAWH